MTMYQFAVVGAFFGFFVGMVNGILASRGGNKWKLQCFVIGLVLGWLWNLP